MYIKVGWVADISSNVVGEFIKKIGADPDTRSKCKIRTTNNNIIIIIITSFCQQRSACGGTLTLTLRLNQMNTSIA
jgi:hypothetical protein